jgi:hypothetical protein
MASEQEARSLIADLEQETDVEVQTTVAPRRPIRRLVVGAVVVACLMGVVAAVGLQQPSQMPGIPPLDMKTVINKQGGSMAEALKHLPDGGKMKPQCKKAIEAMEKEYSQEELACAPDENGKFPPVCEFMEKKMDCHAKKMKRCTQKTVVKAVHHGTLMHKMESPPIYVCLPSTCDEGNFDKDIKALALMSMPPTPKELSVSVDVRSTCD